MKTRGTECLARQADERLLEGGAAVRVRKVELEHVRLDADALKGGLRLGAVGAGGLREHDDLVRLDERAHLGGSHCRSGVGAASAGRAGRLWSVADGVGDVLQKSSTSLNWVLQNLTQPVIALRTR